MSLSSVVDQPHLTPPTVSLLAASNVIDETTARWDAGISYSPEGCSAGQVFNPCNNDPVTGFTKNVSASGTAITGTPWGVVTSDTCGTFGFQVRDYAARATRKLLAQESYWIAKELMTNSLGINVPIPSATNTDATPGSAVSLKLAIAYAEQAFMDCAPGVRPTIHVRPFQLEAMLGLGAVNLRREGNRWYTAMDSLVIADAGYPGTGPAGQAVSANSAWMYVTGPVVVRHGPVTTVPTNMSEAVLRSQNRVTFYAERLVHASFDYNCCVVALNTQRTA